MDGQLARSRSTRGRVRLALRPFAIIVLMHCQLGGCGRAVEQVSEDVHAIRSTVDATTGAMKSGSPSLATSLSELGKAAGALAGRTESTSGMAVDLALLGVLALLYFLSQWSRDIVRDAESDEASRQGDPILSLLCYLVASSVACYACVLYYLMRLAASQAMEGSMSWSIAFVFAAWILCGTQMVMSLLLLAGHLWRAPRRSRWEMPSRGFRRKVLWLRPFSSRSVHFAILLLLVPYTWYGVLEVATGEPLVAVRFVAVALYTMLSTGVFVVAFRDDFPRMIRAIRKAQRSRVMAVACANATIVESHTRADAGE